MTTQTEDLLAFLFDGRPHPLAESMTTWLTSSRRFAVFAATFRDKIRKKLRTAQGQEGLLAVQLELETAYLLLRERALGVAYEPEQSKGGRSPDFAVTFTTSLTFMLEVTRVQTAAAPLNGRLADTVAGKLGQLTPQRSNVLLVAIEAPRLAPDEIRNAMLGLQQRAERSDPALLRAHGFADRAAFFRHHQRLSEVVVRLRHPGAVASLVSWINPIAKHPLPARVRTVFYRSLSA